MKIVAFTDSQQLLATINSITEVHQVHKHLKMEHVIN